MRVSLTIPLLLCTLPAWLWAQASDRARTLHQSAFVFDAHIHAVNRQFYHGGDMGRRVDDGQFDLVRAKEGGLDAMFFSLFVTEQYLPTTSASARRARRSALR
jgi:membrane dipeptidase